MPYARTNWKAHEIKIALSNPVHSSAGPHAHSAKHAVEGELANHPLFQKARVTAEVVTDRQREGNAQYWDKDNAGNYVHSRRVRDQHQVPKAEVPTHSTLDVTHVTAALVTAFNDPAMQPHLATMDGGNDMKVHINYANPIGNGLVHRAAGTNPQAMSCLFVYCKKNPNNADVPIFQTVVPSGAHKVGGTDPIVAI